MGFDFQKKRNWRLWPSSINSKVREESKRKIKLPAWTKGSIITSRSRTRQPKTWLTASSCRLTSSQMLNTMQRQNATGPGVLLTSLILKKTEIWVFTLYIKVLMSRCLRQRRVAGQKVYPRTSKLREKYLLLDRKLPYSRKTIPLHLSNNSKEWALNPFWIPKVIPVWARPPLVTQSLKDRVRWGCLHQLEDKEPADTACRLADQANYLYYKIKILTIWTAKHSKLRNRRTKAILMPHSQRMYAKAKLSRTIWRFQLIWRRIRRLNQKI